MMFCVNNLLRPTSRNLEIFNFGIFRRWFDIVCEIAVGIHLGRQVYSHILSSVMRANYSLILRLRTDSGISWKVGRVRDTYKEGSEEMPELKGKHLASSFCGICDIISFGI